MPHTDHPRLLHYTPTRPFSAIPAYYTPLAQCLPTRPGWYCCRLACGRYAHLVWKCGSFWDDAQEAESVSHWVELPEFAQRVLEAKIPR